LRASNVLKLNIDELLLLNNLLIQKKSGVDYCARKVMEDYNIELMAVTKGAGGSTLYFNGKKNDFESASSNVVDTLGAGDAFAAIICLGYLKKWDMAKMNRLANEFAGQICGIKGALPESDDVYLSLKEKFNDE
jgi:fructokinase